MIIRADNLMRKADARKYGIAAFDVFDPDIVDGCVRAAAACNAAMALCCDCMHADMDEVAHWVTHYSRQFPSVELTLIARNIRTLEEAMQALLRGYRAIVLDERFMETHTLQDVKEFVRVAAAADAACGASVRLNVDTTVEDVCAFAAETGIHMLYLAMPKNAGEAGTAEALEKAAAIRRKAGIVTAAKKADPANEQQMRDMLKAGMSLFDIHGAVETYVLQHKVRTFRENDISPMLFLTLGKEMGVSAGEIFRQASVILRGNRRVF